MIIPIVLLILGIIFIVLGAEFTVEAAKKLAKKFSLSHAFIGLTIISIGTSLPEIFTNILSGIKKLEGMETSGIAVGTNIGSCLTQITLILGITTLFGTMYIKRRELFRDGFVILFSIMLMFFFGFSGFVSRIEGIILVLGYLIYLLVLSKDHDIIKNIKKEIKTPNLQNKHIKVWSNIVLISVGIVLLIISSNLIIENALKIAEIFGLKQSFIGVMIVGVGGALPELSTAIRAIRKDAHGISLGTLIGSNITDPMLSLGSGALIAGFYFEENLLFFDLPFWFFSTLVAMFLIKRNMGIGKEHRREGIVLLGLYAIFIFTKIMFFR